MTHRRWIVTRNSPFSSIGGRERQLTTSSWPTANEAWVAIEKHSSMDRSMLARIGTKVEIWNGQAHQGSIEDVPHT